MRAQNRWLATAVSAVLASSVLGVVPAAAQKDGFDFEPLLMPFPAGEGRILPGSTLHTGGDSHALDLCEGEGCEGGQVGDRVIAPTDLTYDDLSISTNRDETDESDFHFFEIASDADDRLCLSLGHFDLSEPGTLVAGKRTYQQGELLGTLLDFPTVPHVHMGLYTVPAQSRCNSKQRYLDPMTDELRGRTAVAFEGEFAIEGLPVDGSVGSAVTSTNGSGDPSTIRIAQWIEPVEGATVGPRLTLAAWPTPVLLNGSLTDDPTTTRVDFHMMVDGEKVEACSADRANDTGTWACEANLRDLGAGAGELKLTFDVTRTDGGVAPAPGGVRTVVYDVPLTATWKSPAKGAKLDNSILTLSARLGGGSAASGVEKVVYHTQWGERNPKRACVATKSSKKGIWSCKVDLWKLGAPLGKLKLSFNVFDTDGDVTRAPAGTRNVRFASKPPRPTGVSVRVTDYDCPDNNGCRSSWRLAWENVDGEQGYRVYVANTGWRVNPNSVDCSDDIIPIQTNRKLLKTLPAGATSLKGVFIPEEHHGGVLVGSIYYVSAYNAAGESRLSRPARQTYGEYPSCVQAPGA